MKNKIPYHPDTSKEDFKHNFEKNNDSDQREFSNSFNKDEFEYEAAQGYKAFPGAINDIDSIDKNIHSIVRSKRILLRMKRVTLVSIPIVISILIIFYFTHNPTRENKNNLISLSVDSHKINSMNREIEKAQLIPEKEQITSTKATHEQKNVAVFEKEMPPALIEKLQAISVKNDAGDIKNINPDEHYSYLPTQYLYDLKVIDYSNIYRKGIKKLISDGGSLDPKFENRQNTNNSLNNDDISTTVLYMEFLNNAMGKFSANHFKEALKDYIYILQQYPDDQNAHFYGGLCYYNIGLYDNSVTFFNAVLESNVVTFTQEALWYKALSFIQNNQFDEAEILLHKIITIKGFYSAQAQDELNYLKIK